MKLTSTQVMHIKVLLKRERPLKQIAKQFDISEMQVWRIKSGEKLVAHKNSRIKNS